MGHHPFTISNVLTGKIPVLYGPGQPIDAGEPGRYKPPTRWLPRYSLVGNRPKVVKIFYTYDTYYAPSPPDILIYVGAGTLNFVGSEYYYLPPYDTDAKFQKDTQQAYPPPEGSTRSATANAYSYDGQDAPPPVSRTHTEIGVAFESWDRIDTYEGSVSFDGPGAYYFHEKPASGNYSHDADRLGPAPISLYTYARATGGGALNTDYIQRRLEAMLPGRIFVESSLSPRLGTMPPTLPLLLAPRSDAKVFPTDLLVISVGSPRFTDGSDMSSGPTYLGENAAFRAAKSPGWTSRAAWAIGSGPPTVNTRPGMTAPLPPEYADDLARIAAENEFLESAVSYVKGINPDADIAYLGTAKEVTNEGLVAMIADHFGIAR